jgi:hypothetical protein
LQKSRKGKRVNGHRASAAEKLFEGAVRIDCRKSSYLARDAMPYGIQIAHATFGGDSGAVIGNATTPVAAMCQGRMSCTFAIDGAKLADADDGTPKSLDIVYRCGKELASRLLTLAQAGAGTSVHLDCESERSPAASAIAVASATYGGECGAPHGNADHATRAVAQPDAHGIIGRQRRQEIRNPAGR